MMLMTMTMMMMMMMITLQETNGSLDIVLLLTLRWNSEQSFADNRIRNTTLT